MCKTNCTTTKYKIFLVTFQSISQYKQYYAGTTARSQQKDTNFTNQSTKTLLILN